MLSGVSPAEATTTSATMISCASVVAACANVRATVHAIGTPVLALAPCSPPIL